MELWHIMEVGSWPGILDRAGEFRSSIHSWQSAESAKADASQSSAPLVTLCHLRQEQENNGGNKERSDVYYPNVFSLMLYAFWLNDVIWIYHVKPSEAVKSEANAD